MKSSVDTGLDDMTKLLTDPARGVIPRLGALETSAKSFED